MLRALRRSVTRTSALLRSVLSRSSPGRWSEVHDHHLWDQSLAYRLYTPARAASGKGLPLVVMLHGCRQDAVSFAGGTRMNQVADAHHFMVLYPEQSRAANPLRCWNWFAAHGASQGEAARLAQLITQIRDSHAIDHRRVYLMGISAGAAMARVLCIHHPSLFAAAVLHSGLMYGAASSTMDALSAMRNGSTVLPDVSARQALSLLGETSHRVPTLLIHGDQDETVNPVNATQHVEQFLAMASLSGAGLVPADEQQLDAGGRQYRLRDFTHDGQVVLRDCRIEGLAHAWSGGDAQYPFNDAAGPSASDLGWEFVSRYQLDSDTVSTESLHPRLGAWWKTLTG